MAWMALDGAGQADTTQISILSYFVETLHLPVRIHQPFHTFIHARRLRPLSMQPFLSKSLFVPTYVQIYPFQLCHSYALYTFFCHSPFTYPLYANNPNQTNQSIYLAIQLYTWIITQVHKKTIGIMYKFHLNNNILFVIVRLPLITKKCITSI